MANIKSAKKRAIQSEAARRRNLALRSTYRTYIKKVESAITAKDKERAAQSLGVATKVLDRLAAKGILHKNKAARCKSRLSGKIKQL